MLRVAATHQLRIVEDDYTLDQAKQADEAFITAASIYVMPVGRIDDAQIGDGQTGAITSTCAPPISKLQGLSFLH